MRRALVLFAYLQILDLLTTLAGYRYAPVHEIGLGMREAMALGLNLADSLLTVKFLSLTFAAVCAILGKQWLIRAANVWMALVIAWNLVLLIGTGR